jgi:hypothetical protein
LEVRAKKKRFTEEQIAYALAQESTGQTTAEICRKLGVSKQAIYRRKKAFGPMGVSEVHRRCATLHRTTTRGWLDEGRSRCVVDSRAQARRFARMRNARYRDVPGNTNATCLPIARFTIPFARLSQVSLRPRSIATTSNPASSRYPRMCDSPANTR